MLAKFLDWETTNELELESQTPPRDSSKPITLMIRRTYCTNGVDAYATDESIIRLWFNSHNATIIYMCAWVCVCKQRETILHKQIKCLKDNADFPSISISKLYLLVIQQMIQSPKYKGTIKIYSKKIWKKESESSMLKLPIQLSSNTLTA